jgi:two-component system cell cycle response regulator
VFKPWSRKPIWSNVGRTERLSWISEAPLWAEELQHVLVVAEQTGPRQELLQLCMGEGYQASPVATPEMLLSQPKTNVDLILMVLEGHGRSLDLCGEVRTLEAFRSASIMLIAPTPPEPEQAAAALLGGADDYCSFDQRFRCELRARIRVHLRNKRMRDAVERLRGERNNLRTRATVDSLTGALGRRALFDAVEKALAGRQPFAVLFADIDYFKKVNDTFGHQIGDLALQRVAETLSKERRTGDVCGRYGGEEFVLVVSGVSAHEAQRVAERHRRAVAGLRLSAQGGPERITISIGVAVLDPEQPDPSVASILSRADAALYRAKRAGRDCVLMADPFAASAETSDEHATRDWLEEKSP